MIKTTKVYVDKSGGLRIYIPYEMVNILGWRDHEHVILKQHDGRLKIYPEKDHEVMDDDEHLQKQEVTG